MESAFESHHDVAGSEPAKSTWEYGKELFSSTSTRDAWESFKNLVESLPTWALVVAVLAVVTLVANPWLIAFGMAAAALLTASYFTTKHAIRTAMEEHDKKSRH